MPPLVQPVSRALVHLRSLWCFVVFAFVPAVMQAQAPVFTTVPSARQVVTINQNLTLTVAATGATSYQWKRNGLPISGATNASYTITAATPYRDNGWYQAVATNGSGSTTSAVVFVLVRPATSQIVGWGYNSAGQTNVPAGLTNVVRVAAGGFWGLALRADGTVTQWTSGYTVPSGLASVVDVSAGADHSLALKSDGTIVAWGGNSYGTTTVPTGLVGVVAISAGYYHDLALKSDGTVVAWGNSDSGATAVPAGLSGVVAIAAGNGFSLALKSDGTVVGWGSNGNGQSGVPSAVSAVSAIAAGMQHSLGLRADGGVVGWRSGGNAPADVPPALANVAAIAAGYELSLALKLDGTIAAWGVNTQRQLELPANLANVVQVEAAISQTFALALREAAGDTAPQITVPPVSKAALPGQDIVLSVAATGGTSLLSYQWRKNGVAIAGATSSSLALPRIAAADAGNYDVVVTNWIGSATSAVAVVSVGSSAPITLGVSGQRILTPGQSFTITSSTALIGSVSYQWRRNGRVIGGATDASYAIPAAAWRDSGAYQLVATNAVGPAVSPPVFVAVSTPTQLRAWGSNSSGQTTVPASLGNLLAIAAGESHSLALKANGTVVAWGSNANGQLLVPSGLGSVVAIAAGQTFSLALGADGTVTSWGSINYTPSGLTGVVSIAAGINHAMALKSDGSVATWSSSNVTSDAPGDLRDAVAVAGGANHRLALRADGTVIAWGGGAAALVPSGLANVTAIAAGHWHSLALAANGTVIGWGGGSPTPPAGLVSVAQVAASDRASYAITSDGTLVSWSSYAYSPTPPLNLDALLMIAPGPQHALALRDATNDSLPVVVTPPASQNATVSQTVTLSVGAVGGALSYQWRKNGANFTVSGSSITLTNVQTFDSGTYDVVVTNYLGTVTSASAIVTVAAPVSLTTQPASQTVNQGANATFSVTVSSTAPISYQWRKNGTAIAAATNATLLLTSVSTSDAGNYDVVVSNAVGSVTSNAATFTVRSATLGGLVNLSARVAVPTQGAFAYFRVEGSVPKQMLVRAVGPTLAAFGVTGAMADPRLELFNENGATIAANDDWGGSPALSSAFANVGAFSFSAGSKDAALLATLAPGFYAVRMSGVGGSTGEALMELYATDGASTTSPLTYLAVRAAAGGGSGTLLFGFVLAGSSPASLLIRAAGPAVGQAGVLADPALSLLSSAGSTIVSNDDWTTASNLPAIADAAASLGAIPFASGSKDSALLATVSPGALTVQASGSGGTSGVVLTEIFDALAGTAPKAPFLYFAPVSQTVAPGQSATFSVLAGGTGTIAYQWRKNGANLGGATSATFAIPSAQLSDSASYDVLVSNSVGTTTSVAAALTVTLPPPPTVTSSPVSASLLVGGVATFSVGVSSTAPVTYQWRKNGSAVASATNVSYVLTNLQPSDAGNYDVVVTNGGGTATSAVATLTVSPVPPPSITIQPVSVTGVVGGSTNFSVSVSSIVSVSYQWRFNGVSITGATGSSYAIASTQFVDAGAYDVVVTNATGSITSQTVTLVVLAPTPPAITSQPAGGTLNVTNAGSFRVTVTGTPPISYQWRKDGAVFTGSAVSNSTGSTLLLGAVTVASAGTYDVVVTNAYGSATSTPAVLVVNPGGVTITSQPANTVGLVGATVVIAVSATGSPSAPTYQWRKGGVAIPGATSATLTFYPAQLGDAGIYDVIVANSFGSVVSSAATLTVSDTVPNITAQPTGTTLAVGGSTTLSVSAVGSVPFTYQWRRDGFALTGATNATLNIGNAQTYDRGDYTVVVTNALGSATSSAARVNVVPRVLSYSARLLIDGDGALGLFTIEGSVAKKVLLRAVGPGLAPFGLTGLGDPKLELFDSTGNLIAVNDDWSVGADTGTIPDTTAAVGAFALTPGSKDAAIVRTLAPGTYTVRALPASGAAGLGYLELHDADLATGPMSTLPYVAIRGRMGAGGGVVIGGLGANGRGQRSYLVRSVGPALGLAGALTNPAMLVVRDGTLIGNNDDWDANATEAAATTTATTRVATFALPAGSRDAALVLTGNLHAGASTVQVSAGDNIGGTVLLELHDLDAARPASFAPAIVSPPVAITAAIGSAVALRALASGTGPLNFQWRKDGVPISGATGAVYSLASAAANDGGSYVVAVSNTLGTATSLPATITVVSGATGSTGAHAVVGTGYAAGGTVTITNTFTFPAGASALGWTVTLPVGWTFAADGGTAGDVKPVVGDSGTLNWAWSGVPVSPATFTYTLNVPAGTTGAQTLAATASLRLSGSPQSAVVTPSPLSVVAGPRFHSADTMGTAPGTAPDSRLNLGELLRVIELYNYRAGTVRTGQYTVQSGTEDGYTPGPGGATIATYHSADTMGLTVSTPPDGKINLAELLRVIELYNYRAGTVRTGQYRVQSGTEDGFAPGP